mmetsp:Transcript_40095/g.103826  ORF Transcript_40095/g.103826 Transcript_40095/m.103826 type:complete len:361 (-) Transcript_40095:1118-2200(-)
MVEAESSSSFSALTLLSFAFLRIFSRRQHPISQQQQRAPAATSRIARYMVFESSSPALKMKEEPVGGAEGPGTSSHEAAYAPLSGPTRHVTMGASASGSEATATPSDVQARAVSSKTRQRAARTNPACCGGGGGSRKDTHKLEVAAASAVRLSRTAGPPHRRTSRTFTPTSPTVVFASAQRSGLLLSHSVCWMPRELQPPAAGSDSAPRRSATGGSTRPGSASTVPISSSSNDVRATPPASHGVPPGSAAASICDCQSCRDRIAASPTFEMIAMLCCARSAALAAPAPLCKRRRMGSPSPKLASTAAMAPSTAFPTPCDAPPTLERKMRSRDRSSALDKRTMEASPKALPPSSASTLATP